MKFNILTFNNKVGIVADAYILQSILSKISDTEVFFLDEKLNIPKSDIAIWIQNSYTDLLDNFKINIFYINEE